MRSSVRRGDSKRREDCQVRDFREAMSPCEAHERPMVFMVVFMVTMQRDVSAPIEHMRLRSWRFGRDEEAQFHEPKFVGLYKTKINCKVNCTILYNIVHKHMF